MGRLEPNAQYVYKKIDGVTYAQKVGASPDEAIVVGIDWEKSKLWSKIKEGELWEDIRAVAKTNKALHDALERVIILYRLTKDDPL